MILDYIRLSACHGGGYMWLRMVGKQETEEYGFTQSLSDLLDAIDSLPAALPIYCREEVFEDLQAFGYGKRPVFKSA